MNMFDFVTRKPIAPITLVKVPFNPVIYTTTEQESRGILDTFAKDFLLILKEAGCEPSEGFAVCSMLESLIREHSKVVDVSPDECDMVWKDEIR